MISVVRFVVEIEADHRGIARPQRGEGLPVAQERRLRDGAGIARAVGVVGGAADIVPQAVALGAAVALVVVVIEDDLQADLPGIVHDLLHHLHGVQSL
jgi:hypothetical protein